MGNVESGAEGQVPWTVVKQTSAQVRSRFVGCLLGGAVGDALGAPVEFMPLATIRSNYGPEGVVDFVPGYAGFGTITDDTQMTLFTAEGLMRAWVRGRGTLDEHRMLPTVALAYLRWLDTQHESPEYIDTDDRGPLGWLATHRELWLRRAPGATCIASLCGMVSPGEPVDNWSKGCGGVMRMAPVGLVGWHLGHRHYPKQTFDWGVEFAALTHGHPTGQLTAGVLAVLVLALVDGAPLPEALAAAKSELCRHDEHEETLEAIELAEKEAASGKKPVRSIARIGEGWVAEEALAIAIYCALVAKDFRHGVTLAVNLDGDSDSTGAIAGNLLGAMHGLKAIPRKWLKHLELRDCIREIATDLHQFPRYLRTYRDTGEGPLAKYPGF